MDGHAGKVSLSGSSITVSPVSLSASVANPTELLFQEGFSLIGSKSWLKIVRRMDCLLFGTTIKAR